MQANRTHLTTARYFEHTHFCSGGSLHFRGRNHRRSQAQSWAGKEKCESLIACPVVCKASQQAGTAVSDKQKLKDEITRAAGSLNGLDRQAPA